jgi:hypothetical protein
MSVKNGFPLRPFFLLLTPPKGSGSKGGMKMQVCLLTLAQFNKWQGDGKRPRCSEHDHIAADAPADVVAAKVLQHGWRRIGGENILVQVAEPTAAEEKEAMWPFVFRCNSKVTGGSYIEKGLREGLRKGRDA